MERDLGSSITPLDPGMDVSKTLNQEFIHVVITVHAFKKQQ